MSITNLPTLTKVTFRHSDGSEGTFFMREGGNPADYIATTSTVVRTESATFEHAAKAQEVAAHLPGKWSILSAWPDDPRSPFYLHRADGLTLFLHLTDTYQSKGKGHASYQRPQGAKGERLDLYAPNGGSRVEDPSIHFALTKTAEQIAKDITRRLLPEAHEVHALALRAVDASAAYAKREEQAKALAARHYAALGAWGLSVHQNGSSIDVRGYLSPEQFERLLAQLS